MTMSMNIAIFPFHCAAHAHVCNLCFNYHHKECDKEIMMMMMMRTHWEAELELVAGAASLLQLK